MFDQGCIAIMSLESGLVLEFDIESLILKVLVLKVLVLKVLVLKV